MNAIICKKTEKDLILTIKSYLSNINMANNYEYVANYQEYISELSGIAIVFKWL